ncbi:aminotransferase class I/II-fold pyridoxal phosphate-dependent enzyme [Flavihumibacter profundi]|uniref:aminotransferase class I/II-fold pyridoxal phosphate-dependent enzyme n=1 Tax=Flavihumibacter profundi TaxID=2716883 RepID=UPI001CC7A652|nr:aminotransferase class I/II-fold pyridoxal phosphate-dependent enzyme [Flavihumibacter profundi]MBZ5855905.1 aminotransferase class I/II-fold pyridoxal phosphate-dependent enzyme [Flavihumibacter profundi]
MKERFLELKLNERKAQMAYRQLKQVNGMVDFCSNDYLGLSRGGQLLPDLHLAHGSTGSRLLSGNSLAAEELETEIARFHEAEAALIFNSGYDANLGLLSAVPQKGDHIFYDQLSHASIRDGIRLSFAQSFSFRHNDLQDLEKKLQLVGGGEKFIVTEAVFSMDGDFSPLAEISDLCDRYNAHLIVDEAHSIGVIGDRGEGLAQSINVHQKCFARIYTYGKAAGAHGAAVVGSQQLHDYLVNFSRPFIFTTALPPIALYAIRQAYTQFPVMVEPRSHLRQMISVFQAAELGYEKLASKTPIQGIVVPGNAEVKALAAKLQASNLDVRPILYPSVPRGSERLRIVLHTFNQPGEMEQLLYCLR